MDADEHIRNLHDAHAGRHRGANIHGEVHTIHPRRIPRQNLLADLSALLSRQLDAALLIAASLSSGIFLPTLLVLIGLALASLLVRLRLSLPTLLAVSLTGGAALAVAALLALFRLAAVGVLTLLGLLAVLRFRLLALLAVTLASGAALGLVALLALL